jgi:hypothetical protein
MPSDRQPPLTHDELETVRAMIEDYRQDRAVSAWLGSKWRGTVLALSGASALVVVFGSILEIVRVWP